MQHDEAIKHTWSGLRPGGTHVYSSRAQPESSSDCECLCGSPVVGPNGDPLPSSLSAGSKRGNFVAGDGKAGGDRGALSPPSFVVMPFSGQGQLRHTGLKNKKKFNILCRYKEEKFIFIMNYVF